LIILEFYILSVILSAIAAVIDLKSYYNYLKYKKELNEKGLEIEIKTLIKDGLFLIFLPLINIFMFFYFLVEAYILSKYGGDFSITEALSEKIYEIIKKF